MINGATKDRLIAEHASSAELIKPYLRGRDIKRWRLEQQDLWLIFTRRGIEIDSYPAIKRHLSEFREQLEPKPPQWDDEVDGKWKGRKTGSYKWYDIQDNIAYWAEFDEPKIIVPSISDLPNAARDLSNFHTNNKATIFVTSNQHLPLAVLNSPIGAWFARQTFATKAGGFLDFEPRYSQTFVVPSCPKPLDALVDVTVRCIEANCDPRLEQLLNGFVYELFFKEDLHVRNLTLFAEAEKAGLGALSGLEGPALLHAAEQFAASHLVPGARLRTMLSDIATLDVVRIIEGRE